MSTYLQFYISTCVRFYIPELINSCISTFLHCCNGKFLHVYIATFSKFLHFYISTFLWKIHLVSPPLILQRETGPRHQVISSWIRLQEKGAVHLGVKHQVNRRRDLATKILVCYPYDHWGLRLLGGPSQGVCALGLLGGCARHWVLP